MSAWTDEAFNADYEHHYGGAALFEENVQVLQAAITHRCDLCGGSISVGDAYQRTVGMSRGDRAPWVSKQHQNCYAQMEDAA